LRIIVVHDVRYNHVHHAVLTFKDLARIPGLFLHISFCPWGTALSIRLIFFRCADALYTLLACDLRGFDRKFFSLNSCYSLRYTTVSLQWPSCCSMMSLFLFSYSQFAMLQAIECCVTVKGIHKSEYLKLVGILFFLG
jgi:hypothetical protein